MLQSDVQFFSYHVSLVNQFLVIHIRHAWETRAVRHVRSPERVAAHKVDMVSQHHQVAYLEMRVAATAGVRYEQRLYTQFAEHPDRERHLLQRISLVEVETPLHGNHHLLAQLANNQLALVTFHGRYWEVRDIMIHNFSLVSNLLCQAS